MYYINLHCIFPYSITLHVIMNAKYFNILCNITCVVEKCSLVNEEEKTLSFLIYTLSSQNTMLMISVTLT